MTRIVAAMAAAVVLSLGQPVGAQCYRTTGCVQSYRPTYYQAAYPTYATPVYNVPHYESYSNTAVVVGAAYPYYFPILAYTSLADNVRDFYGTKRAAKEGTKEGYLEALREAAAEGIFSGMGGQPQPQPFTPPPGVESRGAAAPTPPNPGPPPAVPKAPGGKGVQIGRVLVAKCASCHNPQTEPDHVDLSIAADRIPGDVRNLCVTWAADGSMPKKGEKLTQEEFDALQAWAKAARPVLTKAIPPAAQPADKK